MYSSIDLHLHTEHSDGTDSATSLIDTLHHSGITIFAVCDHDTIDGCKAVSSIIPSDMQMICGIEFSCKTTYKKCHILGLGIDINNSSLLETISEGKMLRETKLLSRLEHIKNNYNIVFSESDVNYLKSLNSVGKPHIADLLVKYGYSNDISSAIKDYLNFNITNDRIDALRAIHAIKSAGGIPVWAHPLGGESDKRLTEEEFFTQLTILQADGIEGLECYYSRYNDDDSEFLTNVANNKSLLISCGSDYHGTIKNIVPGEIGAENINITADLITVLNRIVL